MDGHKYLFTCYCESDYEKVDDIFLELYKHGIPVKSEKDCSACGIETVISEARAVLFVISSESLKSETISYQLQLAEKYNRHIIPYYLDPPDVVNLPSSFLMKMDGSATIPAYEYYDPNGSAFIKRALNELSPYFPEAFEKKKIKKSPAFKFGLALLACLLLVVGYFTIIRPMNQEKMMARLRNSTVLIYNYTESSSGEASFSIGSGFFVNRNGWIATNYHVIEESTYLLIQPSNAGDKGYLASIVKVDEKNDLAILQIIGDYNVPAYLSFASGSVKTGDTIYVSGYPRGIDLTITNGIVSNNRHLAEGLEYILVTAAVSPGNSGGPIVNSSGKVIGIATAKYSSAENMNLARPVSFLEELLKSVE